MACTSQTRFFAKQSLHDLTSVWWSENSAASPRRRPSQMLPIVQNGLNASGRPRRRLLPWGCRVCRAGLPSQPDSVCVPTPQSAGHFGVGSAFSSFPKLAEIASRPNFLLPSISFSDAIEGSCCPNIGGFWWASCVHFVAEDRVVTLLEVTLCDRDPGKPSDNLHIPHFFESLRPRART